MVSWLNGHWCQIQEEVEAFHIVSVLSKNLKNMLMCADFALSIQECLLSSLANPYMIIGKVLCYSFTLLPNKMFDSLIWEIECVPDVLKKKKAVASCLMTQAKGLLCIKSLIFSLGRWAGVSVRGRDARERGSWPRAGPQPHAVHVPWIQEGQPTYRPAGHRHTNPPPAVHEPWRIWSSLREGKDIELIDLFFVVLK